MRYAEDSPYWDTSVSSGKSQGEVTELLENFGASAVMFAQGQAGERGFAWLVRFQYLDRAYRFVFTPLPCRQPEKVWTVGGKKLRGEDRARCQMGRVAVYFVKAILTAAAAQPAALFGFLELPGAHPGAIPPTAAELDLSGITGLLPPLDIPLLSQGDTSS